MIPIKGKTYEIDFYDYDDPNLGYKGLGKCLGNDVVDESGNQLYIFQLPNNTCHAHFANEDIIKEVYTE
jgi:hypothetical protein